MLDKSVSSANVKFTATENGHGQREVTLSSDGKGFREYGRSGRQKGALRMTGQGWAQPSPDHICCHQVQTGLDLKCQHGRRTARRKSTPEPKKVRSTITKRRAELVVQRRKRDPTSHRGAEQHRGPFRSTTGECGPPHVFGMAPARREMFWCVTLSYPERDVADAGLCLESTGAAHPRRACGRLTREASSCRLPISVRGVGRLRQRQSCRQLKHKSPIRQAARRESTFEPHTRSDPRPTGVRGSGSRR